MRRIIPVVAIGLLASPMLHATPLNYTISTNKTVIKLSWRAFGDTSQASLDGVTGEVMLDSAKEIDNRIEVKIPVATLEASNSLLTYQLKSGLFFDATHYPWIVFTSSRVVAQGHGHFRVFGSLSVKDVQRPVILEATLEQYGSASPAGGTLFLHATTAISRSAFNMDRFTALVDDKVAINIDLQAQVRRAL
ncbi:YceI family protein [Dickeya undicola]|uniref:YceI family protein n=1 Tax=Dickeya undicola TaxID=1577887 RepID=A0A3N0FSG5_9GAMM|nr:YceI family protein [Dickeya undicola]RNM02870.1 YceI family protein [Dickeya undicola]